MKYIVINYRGYKTKGYQFSIDRTDDNFNIYDVYDDGVQRFFRMFIFSFLKIFNFRCSKNL